MTNMKPKFKLGTFFQTEHAVGVIEKIVITRDGVEYGANNGNFYNETEITKTYREVTPRKSKVKTSPKKPKALRASATTEAHA